MKKLLATVLVVFLFVSGMEAAKSKRSAATKRSSSNSKALKSSKRSAKSRAATRRAPSRPAKPTPERYKEIQEALAEKGFYKGPIDGVWSAECVDALKQFQESENLAVDGKLGARSIIALGLGPQRSLENQFLVKPPAAADDEP